MPIMGGPRLLNPQPAGGRELDGSERPIVVEFKRLPDLPDDDDFEPPEPERISPAERLKKIREGRETVRPSRGGLLINRGGVNETAETARIFALPRYRWQDDPELEGLAAWLTEQYALPPRAECRRRCGHDPRQKDCAECRRAAAACVCRGEGFMVLRPIQAAALMTLHDFKGLFAPIRVGGGKTLITWLAGTACEVEKTLLLIPAKLKKKTERDFALLRRHWVAPKRLHIITNELLSRDRGVKELEAYKPDLIVNDEAHKYKNTKAACTRRLRRHLNESNTEVLYLDTSGSTTKRSIMEYHHRINWALQDGFQPLPRRWDEAKDWADAIDEKVGPTGRLMPGALLKLCTPEELAEIAKDRRKAASVRVVRQAYRRRLMETPGVIGTEDQFVGAMALILEGVEVDPGPAVVEAFEALRERWETPDGQPIDTQFTLWALARQLVQGFYYKLDPPPPPEWKMARRAWGTCVRECLHNYRDLDSPLMVTRAIEAGRIDWAAPILEQWRKVKDTYDPEKHKRPEWIDTKCLEFCAQWAKDNVGIIWVWEVAFGEKLAETAGIPYYGAKGLDGRGRMIEDETNTCIASIAANNEGRNLQQFANNLVVSVPPGGDVHEQLWGRTHRDGQEADEVTGQLILSCYEQWDVFRRARGDADYIGTTTGQQQKLQFADITTQDEDELAERHEDGDPLWNKNNAKFFLHDEEWTAHEMRVAAMSVTERARLRRGAKE